MRTHNDIAQWPARGHGGRRRQGGFTLVELLVVVAIVAMMAAVAVPGFSRLGLFARSELQNTSHELLALLKASRIYAATWRVNTGIAYQVVYDQSVEAINAVSMVYQVPGISEEFYTPVGGMLDGVRFRVFPEDIAIHATGFLDDGGTEFPKDSTKAIRILDDQTVVYNNRHELVSYELITPMFAEEGSEDYFPAHIFKPSGQLAVDGSNVSERVRILLGYTPGASQTERYYEDDGEFKLVYIPIDIFRSTGRVKIAREVRD